MDLSSFFRGVVVNTNDPKDEDRVRLRVPAVFGSAVTNWARSMVLDPEVERGDVVWVTFEGADRSRPLYMPKTVSSSTGDPGEDHDHDGTYARLDTHVFYTYEQNTPSAVWEFTHGLGYRPSVTVVDSSGSQVHGEVAYPSVNSVAVTFRGAFSGVAHLS